MEAAAAGGGVARRTLRHWLQRGQDAERLLEDGVELNERQQRYLDLLDAKERAEAIAEVRVLASIQEAIRGGSWQAAVYLLERFHGDRYAAVKRPPVRGRVTGP